MGVNPTTDPDDYELIQSALQLNDLYNRMAGINKNRFDQYRTVEDITSLEQDALRLGKLLMRTFDLKNSTKLHRIMYHVGNHFRDFGDFINGNTAENEMIHKDTK